MTEPRGAALDTLLAIMERLRGVGGCPWDREQTFATIAPYTIEEAYEVADAVERGDMPHLKDELGDLLFQVVFHAQMAREAGHFDFDAVATAISDKLVRRHPHVFGAARSDAGGQQLRAEQQLVVWEDIKAQERAARERATPDAATHGGGVRDAAAADTTTDATAVSALADIPMSLPALLRAFKLSKRAARVGFDFAHASETADKVAEELAEVREAAERHGAMPGQSGASPQIVEEIGDLLFAAANLARKLEVDAETALRAANRKFERRFRGMERLAAERGLRFEALELAAQEALWQEVKRGE